MPTVGQVSPDARADALEQSEASHYHPPARGNRFWPQQTLLPPQRPSRHQHVAPISTNQRSID
ncbi:hypothetical protein RESH_03590 [Rhodopirellula europaea SH398]|uniref:Uncharacterized protein n=1 Tax=Rhodopirellula europaea SH398 TaxID=1263868 RepID=M5SDS5_9BACT|nr:hypothetical protein RESH_03590 [Rhodopirellula europaea SH398]